MEDGKYRNVFRAKHVEDYPYDPLCFTVILVENFIIYIIVSNLIWSVPSATSFSRC